MSGPTTVVLLVELPYVVLAVLFNTPVFVVVKTNIMLLEVLGAKVPLLSTKLYLPVSAS